METLKRVAWKLVAGSLPAALFAALLVGVGASGSLIIAALSLAIIRFVILPTKEGTPRRNVTLFSGFATEAGIVAYALGVLALPLVTWVSSNAEPNGYGLMLGALLGLLVFDTGRSTAALISPRMFGEISRSRLYLELGVVLATVFFVIWQLNALSYKQFMLPLEAAGVLVL